VTAARGSKGNAALQGSKLTVTLVNGVARFKGLHYDKAETMNLKFTTNASGVSTAISSDVVVSAAPAGSHQPSRTAKPGRAAESGGVHDPVTDRNEVILIHGATGDGRSPRASTGTLQATPTRWSSSRSTATNRVAVPGLGGIMLPTPGVPRGPVLQAALVDSVLGDDRLGRSLLGPEVES
jgi:hypothetical protein